MARHPFLSEHLCRFFDGLGIMAMPAVGLPEAAALVPMHDVDAVICDYGLLTTMSLDSLEGDPAFARVPVIAVSLTRHPGDARLHDTTGIAGFLYLPTLDAEDAQRVLHAARRKRGVSAPPSALPWPGTTPVAQAL